VAAEEAIAVTVEDTGAEAAGEIANQALIEVRTVFSGRWVIRRPFRFQIAPTLSRCFARLDIATPVKLRF